MKMTLIPVMIFQILAVKVKFWFRYLLTPEAAPCRCYFLNSSKNFCKILKKTFRKSSMFVTAPDFWPTILLKSNSTMNVFPRVFKNLAGTVISPNTFRAGASMLKVFITSCLYLLLETAGVKRFGKLPKILWRIATFYSYQVFPFEFCKIFINSRFSEHRHGFAFAITYCLPKEKVGKKKVLESSFDNFFQSFHLQVALWQSVAERN